MLSLLLSAALFYGMESSTRLGETSPSLVGAAEVQAHGWRIEGLFSPVDKIETGDGCLTHGTLEWQPGLLGVGVGWSHRHTSQWTKDVLWLRAGLQQGPLRVLAEVAPDSHNREAKIETRLRLCRQWLCGEGRYWIEAHSQDADGYAHGALVLVALSR
jgi:hypothetical protein